MNRIRRVDNIWGIAGQIIDRDCVEVDIRVFSRDTGGVIWSRSVIDYIRVENSVAKLCKRKHEDFACLESALLSL